MGLVGADEPRYAQIAREMLARHDWITPVLNGMPWLEKPILYYWSAMLSYGVFGVSDWAARLPSAVLASVMVMAIYVFTRRLRPGAQLDAALIAASCAGMIGFARGASTDMPLTATFTIGMLAWYTWLDTGRKRWLAGFYVFLALGTLAKGPVAPLLAALIIVTFALARRDKGLIGRTLWWPAVLLYFAVALPWYVAVQWQTPQFFYVFLFQHNLERFGTNLYQHRQPFWYYAPVLLVALVPWMAYVIAAIVSSFRRSGGIYFAVPGTRARARENGGNEPSQTAADDPLRLFLLLWFAVPVVFFSFSESKLPGYILPCIPPGAILLADHLWRKLQTNPRAGWGLPVLHSAVGGLLLALTLLAPYRIVRAAPTSQAEIIAAIAGAVIFLAMLATLRARGLPVLRFATLVPVVLALAFVIRVVAPMVDATESARPVARELDRIDNGKAPVAVFHVRRELRYGLNFYLNQPIAFYDRGEIPASDHLLVARQGSADALRAFVPSRRFSLIGHFAAQHLDYYWVSTGSMHHQIQ